MIIKLRLKGKGKVKNVRMEILYQNSLMKKIILILRIAHQLVLQWLSNMWACLQSNRWQKWIVRTEGMQIQQNIEPAGIGEHQMSISTTDHLKKYKTQMLIGQDNRQ